MIKVVYILLLFFIMNGTAYAQYESVVSNFNAYKTMYNPAEVGNEGALSLTGLYKKSWVGVSNSPETIFFSVHSPLKKEKIALGGLIYQFSRGGISNFKILPSVSYTITGDKSELRFGAGIGLQSYSPNRDYEVNDSGDELFKETPNAIYPQLSFGLSYSWEKWFVSVSAPGVFQINSYEVDQKAEWDAEVVTTFGTIFEINPYYSFRVSGLWLHNVTNLFMFEGMLFYEDLYGLGFVLETSKHWAINAQAKINKQLSVMYSFEVNNQMYTNTSFSHELGLTYNFKYFVDSPGVDFF